MSVSLKRLLILLSFMFALGLHADAQSIEHRITSSEPTRSTVTAPPPSRVEASAALPVQDFRDHPSRDEHNSQGFSPFHVTKTPFMTESRLPLAQISGARLQLNFFMVSVNNRNLTQGPLVPPQTTQQLAQMRGGDLYGIGVSVPLGRDAGSAGSKSLWRGVSRIVHGR
jgi:hypothetical protein